MAIHTRQVRAVVLTSTAVIAVALASNAYLHPPAAAPTTPVSATTAHASATVATQGVEWTEPMIIEQINLPGRSDSGYFVWIPAHGAPGAHGR